MSIATEHAVTREWLTPLQAIALLPDGDTIHTFRNSDIMLIGCDWKRSEIIKALSEAGPEEIEIGGEQCRRMKHGLVLWQGKRPLFIETKELPEGCEVGE